MFKNVVVGGTFDRFHRGHRAFLAAAFSVGAVVSLAVTSDEFLKKRWKTLPGLIQTYAVRVGAVEGLLEREGLGSRARVFKIDTPFDDAHTSEKYDAIVVTEETKDAALKINELRAKAGLSKLVVVEVPLVLADDGKPISSTRIRAGLIDAEGRVSGSWAGRIRTRSEIRMNLAALLGAKGPSYGYDLYKLYRAAYGSISLRLVYYHLAKGCKEGIFKVKEVKSSEGGYSWGRHADRVYYELGPAAAATSRKE